MPSTKTTQPNPSRHKGQRSLDEPLYLTRPFFNWSQPTWVTSEAWRRVVQSQQLCVICREALIGTILSLDWKIEPRDSRDRDELKSEIEYYTRFLENTGDYDYSEIIEWLATDLLDLPFGAAAELGRSGDDPSGRVLWMELLDGGTLYPTLNDSWPVGQYVPEALTTPIFFPAHAINRMYFSPRTEIKRKGWGMAPPEKIWIALNLLSTGDNYYARLLLDTPDAGILDLIDMEEESAKAWVDAWRKLLNGVDPQKIPVLYEHSQAAKWIPFTRNPGDIQYNEAISRYTTILTSGYGLAPSDVGLGGGQNGGNTMAGNLRDERRSKRNGYARLKRKFTEFFNRLLPSSLRFRFIDMDDELMVAVGRARLASATAMGSFVSNKMFSPEEMRAQAIADGYITVSVPEDLPKELVVDTQQSPQNSPAERPSMLGRPVTPSSGGWGETAARSTAFDPWISKVMEIDPSHFQRLAYLAYQEVSVDVASVLSNDSPGFVGDWVRHHDDSIWSGSISDDLPELSKVSLSMAKSVILSEMKSNSSWWKFTDVEESVTRNIIESSSAMVKSAGERIKTRAYVESFDIPNISVDDGILKSAISQNVSGVFEYLPEIVSSSVISSLRDCLLRHQYSDVLDVIYDPEIISEIRSRALRALHGLSDAFDNNVSGIIIDAFVNSASNSE